ncbi:hypothetical protein BBP40_011849 [Aspergillus hancockii]|nr:hypothetical protein BBP40_011849 [Aspergillus hancockii]
MEPHDQRAAPAPSASTRGDGIAWKKNPADQSQSTLFRLPPELRAQIYQYVLGGKVIHLTQDWNGTFVHCVCAFKGRKAHLIIDNPPCYCKSVSWTGGALEDSDRPGEPEGPGKKERPWRNRIPLLATCQQIYSEAIDILPSQNTINIQILATHYLGIMGKVQSRLPSHHFHSIRSLEITYGLFDTLPDIQDPTDDRWFKQWNEMFEVIASMKSLVDLHIWARIERWDERGLTPEIETRFFAPLLGFNHLRHFQVEVAWPATTASAELLRNAPFVLVRMDDAIFIWPYPDDGPLIQTCFGSSLPNNIPFECRQSFEDNTPQATGKRRWRERVASLIPFWRRDN